jgi:hypothetical protein
MTPIEQFQNLQVELVRAGFDTDLRAEADHGEAVIAMFVELKEQTTADIERLNELTGTHGFSCVIGEDSRAAIKLAAA